VQASALTLDLNGPRSISNAIAYSLPTQTLNTAQLTLASFSDTKPLVVPSCQFANFQLFHIAPVESNGWAVLGELAKWTPVASARVKEVDASTSDLAVSVAGQNGETVELWFVNTSVSPLAATSMKCVIAESGRATFNMPAKTCS